MSRLITDSGLRIVAAFLLCALRRHPRRCPVPRRRSREPEAAQSESGRHQRVGPAARRADVGLVGRPRHWPRRSDLDLRSLRGGCADGRVRHEQRQPHPEARSRHGKGAGQLRRGAVRPAARPARGSRRQRVGHRLTGEQGRNQGPSGDQVQPQRRGPDEAWTCRRRGRAVPTPSTSRATSSRLRTATSSSRTATAARARTRRPGPPDAS